LLGPGFGPTPAASSVVETQTETARLAVAEPASDSEQLASVSVARAEMLDMRVRELEALLRESESKLVESSERESGLRALLAALEAELHGLAGTLEIRFDAPRLAEHKPNNSC
jgi:hypothetical protein